MVVVRSKLNSQGYVLKEAVLNGNDFGALERRSRLVVVAISKGLPDVFDFGELCKLKEKEGSLNEVLEDVPHDSARFKSFDYLANKEVRDKADGKGFSRQLLSGAEDFCGTIGRGYAKCRSTEPFLVHPTNPQLSRLLTPVEHARVKGIPEVVIAGLPDTTAHEVLGQSVIYPLIESVGLEIGVSITAAVNASVVSLRQEGISSYCGQICGGDDCGAGQLCSFGINSESQMPGLPESEPNQGQFQLSLMVA